MARERKKGYGPKKPIAPIPRYWNPPIVLVQEEQRRAIHGASLTVLEHAGMRIASEEAREILARAGARVEEDRVFFPWTLVEGALRKIPSVIRLCGRTPEEDLLLDGRHTYMNLDGNGMEILDFETGVRRPTNLADLETATRLADYLEQIGYVWPIATARDCPVPVQPLYETRCQLRNTTKHVMTMTVADGFCARGVIDMAAAVAGGREALRRRPLISLFESVTSPLALERGACEALLAFAREGLPTGIMTMPLSGATAPVTVAGNLVLANAEVLAGLTLVQCVTPGCPSWYASCSTVMDLKSGGVTSNGPEDYLIQAGTIAMARIHYNIPVMTGVMGTEARAPGWQSAVEDSLSVYTSALCGADLMPGAGLLKNATVLSYEELVLGCEIYEMVRRVKEGFPADAESLAVEAILRVGPRGDFMTDPHTLEHMRELWQPEVLRRCSFDAWESSGRADALERAREKAAWIMEHHAPEPLSASVDAELDRILEIYAEEKGGI